ncbi:MAG: plastocyanin/azurin family copper-binding protein, partial [Verrucomicrobiota bacterium]
TSASGEGFATDLFSTIRELSHTWRSDGDAVQVAESEALKLRIRGSKEQKRIIETGKLVEGERRLILEATSGLKYKQTTFLVKPGEPLVLHFRNQDVMPHNVVFVKEGAVTKVGEASFKMLNDPKAADKHYVPDMPEVLNYTHVIEPGNQHILHFRAPAEPGEHHFVCTFPGHWMTMQGRLIVKE